MLMPITDADIPGLVVLMNAAYRGSGTAAGWNSEAGYISGDRTTADLIRAELAASPGATYLKWLESGSEVLLGCVWLEQLDQGEWYLGSLATAPALQGAGLGKAILAAAEQWVRERGGLSIRMSVVNVRDTLIDWYLRRGYRLTGETEPFPYDDNRFGTPLRPDLHFVVMAKDLASLS